MAEGDAVIEIERRADGDGELTDTGLRRVGELQDGQPLGGDADDGEIGLLVHAADFGVVFPAVAKADFDFVRAVHDMAVGEDVAVFADDNAGALAVEDRFAPTTAGAFAFLLLLHFLLELFAEFLG